MTADSPDNTPEQRSSGEFIVYRTEDGRTEVQLLLVDGTVWLSQKELSELYGIGVSTVSRHVKAILDEGELDRAATVAQRENVALEQGRSVTRRIEVYSLDLIMAVGYRVRGPRGNQFRNWATTVLAEYLIKGFAMNDAKLKDPAGQDYFAELLERIRDIRASEARFYQQIRDIFATSADYDPKSLSTAQFFQQIQNKLHFAIAGQTAPEIIALRADPSAPNMGVQHFKGEKPTKQEAKVAKNYLTADELRILNRFTTMFLDYAQDQAERRNSMTMTAWVVQTDRFIAFNEYPVLTDNGRLSRARADELAMERYDLYKRQLAAASRDEILGAEVDTMRRIERQILAAQHSLKR
ncbi:RhuM family protein [Rhodococcoides fascians]|uniref:RhuM family protein n=1 Tax=Rhodococcoides fascians TaxID=1828 RepID=UPI00068C280B|nr:RhuM family protein [Rhodococcus fascians]